MGISRRNDRRKFNPPHMGFAFPEMKNGTFPPQRAVEMKASYHLGRLPDGVRLSDLPTWRPSGTAVVVKYLYTQATDGHVIRMFVGAKYVGEDVMSADF